VIEGWRAADPRLTAVAILGRLSQRFPNQFGPPQHSIVQRLLKALRVKAACQLIARAQPAVPIPVPGAMAWLELALSTQQRQHA